MHPLCLTILAVRYARPHNMPACSRPLGIAGLLLRGSVRVPFLAHAMPLSELLQSEGLSEALVKVAIAAGWSIRLSSMLWIPQRRLGRFYLRSLAALS